MPSTLKASLKLSMERSLTRHSSKNKYIDSNAAQKAAAKYTRKYGFIHRWYECDECEYWHLSTVTHHGIGVLSLEAIQRSADE